MVHNVVINVEPAWVWANGEEDRPENEENKQMKLQQVLVMVPVQQPDDPSSAGVLKVVEDGSQLQQVIQADDDEGTQWILQGDQWQLQAGEDGMKEEPQQLLLQSYQVGDEQNWNGQQLLIQQDQDSSETWYLEQQGLVQNQDVDSELLIVSRQPNPQAEGEMVLVCQDFAQTKEEVQKEVVFSVQNIEPLVEASTSYKGESDLSGSGSAQHAGKQCECNKCRKPPGPSYLHMFNCDVCGKPFSQKKWLVLHKKTHKKKVYRCTICSKRFSCRSECNVHVRLHKGKKPHECYVCGKWFSTGVQLNSHLQEHGSGKTFQCNVCTKSFSSLNELNDHFKDHTNEAPCTCHKCGKIFDCKKTFALHLITHNKEEKSYECVLCGNLFPQASSLAHHLRTHSECYVCGQVFSFSSDLVEHLKEHIDIDPTSVRP